MRKPLAVLVSWPVCASGAVLFLLAAIPAVHTSALELLGYSVDIAPMSGAVTVLAIVYAAILLAGAAADILLRRCDSSLATMATNLLEESYQLVRDAIRALRGSIVADEGLVWLASAFALGLGIRSYYLAQPIRYDEAFTFLRFVNTGPEHLFYYPVPNNHVLHTLLVKLATSLAGPSPAAIRLPAFLAGLLAIPLAFGLAKLLLPRSSGLIAVVSTAVYPYLVLYGTNARGYSLLVVFVLVLVLLGSVYRTRPSAASTLPLAAVAALGLWTIPTMLFAIAGLYLWIFSLLWISRLGWRALLRSFVVPCGLLTALFTLILYTPVIVRMGGAEALVASKRTLPLAWNEFVSGILPHARIIAAHFSRGVPLAVLAIGALAVLYAWRTAVVRRDWPAALLLPSMLAGAAILFFARRGIPAVRTWIYLIPIAYHYLDYGPSKLLRHMHPRARHLVHVAFFVLVAWAGVVLAAQDRILSYRDTGTFWEAEAVVRLLGPRLADDTRIHSKAPVSTILDYYLLWYDDTDYQTAQGHELLKEIYVVKVGSYELEEMTDEDVPLILAYGEARVYAK